MDVFDAIQARRSIRRYKNRPVPPEAVNRLLEAARLAPSAFNLQNWKFLVLTDQEIIKKLPRVCLNQKFTGEAPLVIVGITLSGRHPELAIPSLFIALEHIVLEAVELGLGSCWVCGFHEEKLKSLLQIPSDKRVGALITLGFPDETPPSIPRKSLEEIACWNKFQ